MVRVELTTCCLRNSRSVQLKLHRHWKVWPGREADAPLRTPRFRQSPFCRNESRPDKPSRNWYPRKDSNLQPLVCRTSARSLSYSGIGLVVGVGIEPTFRVFQTRANPSQLSDP